MFLSPCAVRSTQCAALIALAAAAGIARVETSAPTAKPTTTPSAILASRPGTSTLAFFFGSSPTAARWAHQFQAIAWWLAFDTAQKCDAVPSGEIDPPGDAMTIPECAPPPLVIVHLARRFTASPTRSLGCMQHRLPFAVGPPAQGALHPNAVGTRVPGDLAAVGLSRKWVARNNPVRRNARLARLISPSRHPAGTTPGNQFAPRGDPGVRSYAAPRDAGRWRLHGAAMPVPTTEFLLPS